MTQGSFWPRSSVRNAAPILQSAVTTVTELTQLILIQLRSYLFTCKLVSPEAQ
jgi:hypothetical protein